MKRLNQILILFISIVLISQLTLSDEIKVIEINEGELVSLRLTAVDEDGDELTYIFSKPLNEIGQWQTSYGDYGEYNINVSVSDGKTETTEEIILIVHKVNWPPILEEFEDTVITETDRIQVIPQYYDEEGGNVEIKISEPIGDDGIWATSYDDAGEYNIKVQLIDGQHIVSETFNLFVEELNRDPVIDSLVPEEGVIDIKEEESIEFEMIVFDLDEDDLIYSWLLDNVEVSSRNKYVFSTDYESAGGYKLSVSVSDGVSIIERDWNIIVENVNRAPVLEPIEDIFVNETEKIVLDFNVYDLDKDDIKYMITDPVGNDKEWQTSYDDAGEYLIEVTITDGEFNESQIVRITVLDIDRAPLFKKIDNVEIGEGDELIINLEAEDPDEDEVTFTAEALPYGMSLNGTSLKYSPDYDLILKPNNKLNNILGLLHLDGIFYKDSKNFDIKLTVHGKEKSTSQKFKIKVKDINRAPMFLGADEIMINETEVLEIKPIAIDPDNDYLSFGISEPVGDDGMWLTNYNDAGEYKVMVYVSDGSETVSEEVSVVVKNLNREPIFRRIRSVKVDENEEFTIKFSVNDLDEDELKISVENKPDGASLVDNVFKWKPNFDITEDEKEIILTFTADDGEATVKQDALIIVKGANRLPVVLKASPKKVSTVYLNDTVVFKAEVFDYDSDSLSYQWKFGAFNGVKTKNPAIKRRFTSTGVKTIKLLISDGDSSITKTWKVNVVEK